MAERPEETLVVVEHRYACSECGHLSPSLEDALLHHQHHLPEQHYELLGLSAEFQSLAIPESSQYQCLECGQLLVSPGQLLEHQEMHLKLMGHDDGTVGATKTLPALTNAIHYECVECKALFDDQDLWLSHRQSHHRSQPPIQSQALVQREHSYRKPGEEEEEEDDEASAAARLDTLQLLLYECGQCFQLFQTPKDFLEHQATHNDNADTAPDHTYEVKEDPDPLPVEHPCSECPRRFATWRRLQSHLRCHRLGAFHCPLCSKVLPDPTALEQHLQGDHGGESHFLCLDCGLAFDTEAVLLAHRRAHCVNPLHRCPCGKAFVNMTKFLYHRRSHHRHHATDGDPDPNPNVVAVTVPPPSPSFPCPTCAKTFATAPQLARHQRFVHRLERRHPCPDCGKLFKKKSHVRNHLLTHTGERPFPCPQCPKTFNSQANLLRHRLVHTGE
ncbi:zinc finger protein 574-like, partial [Pezoporus wallicus]|uniref:zinc finger protein 574-like n=1 Tax=Pezoporus wallicus TaxID=35540 RepID=UPI00254AC015